MKKKSLVILMSILMTGFAFSSLLFPMGHVSSQPINEEQGLFQSTQEPPQVQTEDFVVVSPYLTIVNLIYSDGTEISGDQINGPSEPPPEYEAERQASIVELSTRGTLTSFPSYDWVFGCSSVSAAMIAGYYDNNGYPNMYAGPTNGGDMPITDTSWGTWSDGYDTYPNNPLIASHNGVDGRTTRGSIDDYWVRYNSSANDPYITNGWTQHTWETAVGDFMKTSQSEYDNVDGSTVFYNWTSNTAPLTCDDMEANDIDSRDGTYGRKLFYEARGYTVEECYNQKTDNNGGGFTLVDFQNEIDAGHPVFLNLAGHSIVGFGYSGSTLYIRDTWDSNPNNIYSMTWGGSYGGMDLRSVSIVRLSSIATSPPDEPTGVAASDGNYSDKVRVSWNASSGATRYEVYRNTSNSHTGETQLASTQSSSPYDDTSADPETTYYYWVKACNSAGCSGYSSYDTGYRAAAPPSPPAAPTGVSASDGTYTDKVRVSWNASSGATWYEVYRNRWNTHSFGQTTLTTSQPSSPYDDTSAVAGTTYYYWVKACNAAGCSDYSSSNTGYRSDEPPAVPTGVAASDGSYTDKVRVSWNASSGATEYEVYRNTSNSHTGETQLTDSQSSSPYDDTSADPGTTYYYWVKACNSNGCSDYSSDDTGYRALTAPTSIAASDGTYTDKVRVTWSASSGATEYEVYRNTANSHTGETQLTSTQSASPYDDTSADPGTTYYYWVKACNSNGCSDYSSFDTGYRALTAPTSVTASDGTYTDKVTVVWTGSNGATYYQVFRNTTDSHSGEVQLVGDQSSSPFDDVTAVPGTNYYYWVKACNIDYCSDYSAVDLGWRAVEPVYYMFLPLVISD